MKKLVVGGILAAALLTAMPVANAAEFIAPGRGDNGAVTITASQPHKNLYASGNDVLVSSAIAGDLYIAGGSVIVEGAVEQDLVAAGGTVILNGAIGGDLRVTGGKIVVNGSVAGDILVFGGTVTLSDRSAVGGDLIAASGMITVSGPVTGSVRAMAEKVTLDSRIGGAVAVRATDGLVLGPRADIPARVAYKGGREAELRQGAQVAGIDFQQESRAHDKKGVAAFLGAIFGVKLLAALVAGLLLVYLLPRRTSTLVHNIYRHPWLNLGVGLLTAIVVPIVLLIITVILVGYYLAFLGLLWYLFCLALASLVAAVFAGAWLIKLLTKKPELRLDWQAVLLGVVILMAIKLIPVIGWLVVCLLSLMSFGALARLTLATIKHDRHDGLHRPPLAHNPAPPHQS